MGFPILLNGSVSSFLSIIGIRIKVPKMVGMDQNSESRMILFATQLVRLPLLGKSVLNADSMQWSSFAGSCVSVEIETEAGPPLQQPRHTAHAGIRRSQAGYPAVGYFCTEHPTGCYSNSRKHFWRSFTEANVFSKFFMLVKPNIEISV